MATVPERTRPLSPSRILLGIAVILFLAAFCMGVGFLFDKKAIEDILAVDSMGLAFVALALIV